MPSMVTDSLTEYRGQYPSNIDNFEISYIKETDQIKLTALLLLLIRLGL
jgi:hypothetical protein